MTQIPLFIGSCTTTLFIIRKGENIMGITSKQTGKFRGMMRKIENEQLKIKADSVKRKKKDGNKNA